MPDGSPQLTQTWVTTDGEHVVVNVVDGHQKARNLARDARVAVNIVDPDNVFRYYAVRGRVIDMTTEGGRESIDEISQKYLGHPVSELHRSCRDPASSSRSRPTRSCRRGSESGSADPRPWAA